MGLYSTWMGASDSLPGAMQGYVITYQYPHSQIVILIEGVANRVCKDVE